LIPFQEICKQLATKVSGDPNYINNLTYLGTEYAEPEVNLFFTSAEYLQVVSLLSIYGEGCESPLEDFLRGMAKNEAEYKQIQKTVVCLYPFVFAIDNPELQ
jgi:hypothetical protein